MDKRPWTRLDSHVGRRRYHHDRVEGLIKFENLIKRKGEEKYYSPMESRVTSFSNPPTTTLPQEKTFVMIRKTETARVKSSHTLLCLKTL